jgi:hypothetical protein
MNVIAGQRVIASDSPVAAIVGAGRKRASDPSQRRHHRGHESCSATGSSINPALRLTSQFHPCILNELREVMRLDMQRSRISKHDAFTNVVANVMLEFGIAFFSRFQRAERSILAFTLVTTVLETYACSGMNGSDS